MHLEGSPPPMEAETHAFKAAIFWLENLGLSNVDIELDYLLVVEAINNILSDQMCYY
jgi:hypothetical protein